MSFPRVNPFAGFNVPTNIGSRVLPSSPAFASPTAQGLAGTSGQGVRSAIARQLPGDAWSGPSIFRGLAPETMSRGQGAAGDRLVRMEDIPSHEGIHEPVAHQRAIRGMSIGDPRTGEMVAPMPTQYELLFLHIPSHKRASSTGWVKPALDEDSMQVSWLSLGDADDSALTPATLNYMLFLEAQRKRATFTGEKAYEKFLSACERENAWQIYCERFWLAGAVFDLSLAMQPDGGGAFPPYAYSASVGDVQGVPQPMRQMVTYEHRGGSSFLRDYCAAKGSSVGSTVHMVVRHFAMQGSTTYTLTGSASVLEREGGFQRTVAVPTGEVWPVPQVAFVARPTGRPLPGTYLVSTIRDRVYIGHEMRIGKVFSREMDTKTMPYLHYPTLPEDLRPFTDARESFKTPPIKVAMDMDEKGF